MDKNYIEALKYCQERATQISQLLNLDIDFVLKKILFYANKLGYPSITILESIYSMATDDSKDWDKICQQLDQLDPLTIPQPSYDEKISTQALKEYFSNQPTIEEAKNNLNTLIKASLGEIEIKLGDKVIRKDGLVGKITAVGDTHAVVTYENGYICALKQADCYLIGKVVLGNKIDEEELQRQLDEQWDKVKSEQAKYDQLRKQLWYLKNRMVEDWYEKKQQADKEKAEQNLKTEKVNERNN